MLRFVAFFTHWRKFGWSYHAQKLKLIGRLDFGIETRFNLSSIGTLTLAGKTFEFCQNSVLMTTDVVEMLVGMGTHGVLIGAGV